jgi:hypothetical protein
MEVKEVKGILHCHSQYSYDAKLTLSELRDVCIRAAFVKECDQLSDGAFRFIPGFEVPYRSAHILMVGMRRFHGVYASNMDALRKWTSDSPFVVLAHPVRNDFEVADDLCEVIDALEVWNQQYEGKRVPRIRSLKLLEKLRMQKPLLRAIGGVDFHRKEHMGTPVITLSVEDFTEDFIIEKLKEGAFLVSSTEAHFYGTLPNISELIRIHRIQSHISVCIIVLGKMVNKIFAALGMSLPKSLKQYIRRSL